MRYRVLGPFEVADGERVLDLGRPKQRAVLAMLLLEANGVVSLDRLIDLLWGDEPPARSTASLQVYVANLRRVLEPGRQRNQPFSLLVTRPPGYTLRIGPDELDACRFEALAAEGRRLLAGGRPRQACVALDEALALWRGDALADLASHRFTRSAVARWDELRQVATEDRIQADLDLGEHGPAVAELKGLVAEFPFRERLWGLLMLALYRDGRQGEALRAYSEARLVLMDTLGVEPGPELRRVESEILAQAPTLAWPGGLQAAAQPSVAGGRAPVSPPLVGRTTDLARLDGALADAAAGHGRVVLIAGEPGIGKTRLADELVARASAAGAAVAWGRNNEDEGAPAFWPWAQALHAAVDQADSNTWVGDTGPPGAAWVARLVPDAAGALGSPGPPPALGGESARFELHQAIMSTLTAIAARRPLVIVIDDLHWADAASLALWDFVAARLEGARLLLVGTYRPSELGLANAHPLVPTLAAVARHPGLERITLEGLTVTDVARLVEGGWAVVPPDELAVALHARTEGNPFFLIELAKLLASEGSLGRADADAVTAARVPAGVRDVLRRRLSRLPPATNATLRVASVIGRTFDLDVLAPATDIDGDRTLEAVEAALVTGIVVEDPATVGRYRFTHALVQQVIYEELSAVRRARLHARVGTALENLAPAETRLSELAVHFYRAAPAVGPEKAVTYALEAAAEAQTRLAYEAVEEHLTRALELIAGMPAGPDRDRHELRVQNRLALSLMMNGGLVSPTAAQACDRAAELALRLGDTRELLCSMAGLSKAAIVRSEWEVVSSLGERMVALGDASGDALSRAAGLFALGNAELFVGDIRRSRGHVEEAIEVARPLWEQSPEAAILWVNPLVFAQAILGLGLCLSDEEGPAAAALREALALADGADQLFWQVGVQLCVAVAHALGGRVTDARAEAERCIELGRATGLRVVVSVAAVIRSWAFARVTPGPAELSQLRADLDACDAEGVSMWRPLRLALLADACNQARCWQDAVAAADEGLVQCERAGERVCEAELHRLRGVALASAGGRAGAEEAAASLRRAVSVAESQGATLFLRRATDTLSRLMASAPS